MSDETVIVRHQGTIFLAGPPLVQGGTIASLGLKEGEKRARERMGRFERREMAGVQPLMPCPMNAREQVLAMSFQRGRGIARAGWRIRIPLMAVGPRLARKSLGQPHSL